MKPAEEARRRRDEAGVPVPPPVSRVTTDTAERPLLAIALVVLAMIIFSATDGAAKYLSAALTPQQIIWVRYAVVLGILLPALLIRHRARVLRTHSPGLQILRGLVVAASSLLYTFALQHLPLELCTAIGFVSPFYVTALSIPFLGERVGARRWAAVAVGFVGVLVILRPGGASFQWPMLLPLLSSLFWAVGLILTRFMRGSERPSSVLAWSSLVGFVAVAPLAWPLWQHPDPLQWALLISLGVFNAVAQYLVIRAFMLASASLLAPFSYSTIVWATLIGLVVFDSVPDATTVAGTGVLIAAGLYVWHRERVRHVPPTVTGASLGEAVEPEGER